LSFSARLYHDSYVELRIDAENLVLSAEKNNWFGICSICAHGTCPPYLGVYVNKYSVFFHATHGKRDLAETDWNSNQASRSVIYLRRTGTKNGTDYGVTLLMRWW
jgi:hypothetical protein